MLNQLLMFINVCFLVLNQLFFFQGVIDSKKKTISAYSDVVIYQHLNALSFCSLSSDHCRQYDSTVIPPEDYQIYYYSNSGYDKKNAEITCVNNGYLYSFVEKNTLKSIDQKYNLSGEDVFSAIMARSENVFFLTDSEQGNNDGSIYDSIPENICHGDNGYYKKKDVGFILVNYIGL